MKLQIYLYIQNMPQKLLFVKKCDIKVVKLALQFEDFDSLLSMLLVIKVCISKMLSSKNVFG